MRPQDAAVLSGRFWHAAGGPTASITEHAITADGLMALKIGKRMVSRKCMHSWETP